jgi:hypothetical protein
VLIEKSGLKKILKKMNDATSLKRPFFIKKWHFYAQKAIASSYAYGYGLGGI